MKQLNRVPRATVWQFKHNDMFFQFPTLCDAWKERCFGLYTLAGQTVKSKLALFVSILKILGESVHLHSLPDTSSRWLRNLSASMSASAQARIERGDEWHWTLRLKESPELHIGAISLHKGAWDNRGYWLGLPLAPAGPDDGSRDGRQ